MMGFMDFYTKEVRREQPGMLLPDCGSEPCTCPHRACPTCALHTESSSATGTAPFTTFSTWPWPAPSAEGVWGGQGGTWTLERRSTPLGGVLGPDVAASVCRGNQKASLGLEGEGSRECHRWNGGLPFPSLVLHCAGAATLSLARGSDLFPHSTTRLLSLGNFPQGWGSHSGSWALAGALNLGDRCLLVTLPSPTQEEVPKPWAVLAGILRHEHPGVPPGKPPW